MQPQDPRPAQVPEQPEVPSVPLQPTVQSAPQVIPSTPPVATSPAVADQAPAEPPIDSNTVDEQPEDKVVADGPTPLPQQQPIQWQAAEYLQHAKTPLWYVGFVAVVIILMVSAILLMNSWTFAILIPVMAVALMVYSHRPARELNYVLSTKGLYINDQLHPLGEFKGFGVVQDGTIHSLVLIPLKRFRPGLTVYFPVEVGEAIVDLLGSYLPMQELKPDAFDKIVRKLRI